MKEKAMLRLSRIHVLISGIQVVLDLWLLVSGLVLAYLLRFDFEIPRNEVHNLMVQIPFVVLLQFVALTLTGARTSIWRYTGLAHVKAFLYAALGSLIVVALMRLTLAEPHQAWRVPLSVNVFDGVLAFGGAFGLRVLRRAVFERNKRLHQVKENVNGKKKRPVLLIG